MRKKSILEWSLLLCWALLFFFFMTIAARFLTRQILVERLHWDNAFTRLVFLGSEKMGKLEGEDDTAVLIPIDWPSRYPFTGQSSTQASRTLHVAPLDAFKKSILKVEEKIEDYASDNLFGRNAMVEAARRYNECIGSPAMRLGDTEDREIFLQNGYLTYEEALVPDLGIEEIADSVQDFADFLHNEGIHFVYMNAGSKVCPYDRQLPEGAVEYTNENADNLLRALEERSVATLDFREHMIADGLDWYDSYYITDHHWKTTTGLWAAGVMAEYLNQNCGFDFDTKYFEKSQYEIETYDNFFLGGQGRLVTLANSKPESYERVLPRYATHYALEIPTRGIKAEGTYGEILFDHALFAKIASYGPDEHVSQRDAYHCCTVRNDALSKIKNLHPVNNDGKKILMIYDSFSWYTATFLAADVEEIVTLHLGAFDGSLRTLVKEMQPDAVVMVYCARNIRPIADWNSHTEKFDLR